MSLVVLKSESIVRFREYNILVFMKQYKKVMILGFGNLSLPVAPVTNTRKGKVRTSHYGRRSFAYFA